MGDADLEGNVAFVGGTESYSNDHDDSVVDEGSKSEGKRGVKRKLEDEDSDKALTEEDIGTYRVMKSLRVARDPDLDRIVILIQLIFQFLD